MKTLTSVAFLTALLHTCLWNINSRHDPILQAVQVHRAVLAEPEPSREGYVNATPQSNIALAD